MLSEKEIIERYYEEILKYCLTKMKREDAEVITQDVFCDYLEKNKIEEIRNPRSYLYSVARSKIGAFYRKRTVIRSYEVSDGKIYDLINNNHDMDNDDGLIEDEYRFGNHFPWYNRERLRDYWDSKPLCADCAFEAYEEYYGVNNNAEDEDEDGGLSVHNAALIWASHGKDEDYMFGYTEDELEDAL